jgi:eukaryotic-like serine/threonine-protein kinase
VQHPEQLGKYRITEVLGEGAMGVVYKGFDPDIKRTVAIKTIRRQFGVAGEGVSAAERFRNEAVAAGRLTHPGIVAVYDFGEHGDVAYIAMEFVEGRTLAHYLSSRVRFTDEDIPGVISQVLDALEHAHDAGVWHRDIKPANIIMAKNGKLKVADFGIARIEDAGLTQANVMIGTPTYMAPEQFLGTSMDRRVDIYAAGVLLYLLLTGRPPFTGAQHELMYKVVHQPPVMPSQIEGMNRPSFYDAILSRALAKNPDDRYPDAASFKADVQRGVGQPFDTTVWEQTVVRAAGQLGPGPATPGPGSQSGAAPHSTGGSSGSWSQLADHWDKSVLQEAEASLAKVVGPLASVLVRRAARECTDLPTLYQKLAEQVTNPEARTAFLERATTVTAIKGRTGSGSGSGSGTSLAAMGSGTRSAPASGGGSALSDELLDAATRLVAQHVGPIAKVLVKKTAARTSDRNAFFIQLADAVPDSTARQALLTALQRLA